MPWWQAVIYAFAGAGCVWLAMCGLELFRWWRGRRERRGEEAGSDEG